MDGRSGTAGVGPAQRKGLALKRDTNKRVIAFHVVQDESFGPEFAEPSHMDQFVIGEDDFEPASVPDNCA